MLIAVPTPRFIFEELNFDWLYHFAPIGVLDRIIQATHARTGEWASCDIELLATSGFGNHGRRLFRDYSVLDFELTLEDRGAYSYFFCGEPSAWGRLKNLSMWRSKPAEDYGLATIRIRPSDLLDRYDGPLFFRLDDTVLVIRGGYAGPAEVTPVPNIP